MAELFQDVIQFYNSSLGVQGEIVLSNTNAGAKSIIFQTSANAGHLAWNPTANRTLNLPDVGGTLATGTAPIPVVSNAIQSVGSATGSGTNTTRFAADDHVHAGVQSMGVSNLGNTAGNTRVDVGQFVFQGSNMTLSQVTAANALNTIIFSVGAGGGVTNMTVSATSNTTQSSTGTIALSSFIIAGAGAASVGVSNGSIIISAPNAAAGNVTFSAGANSSGLGSVIFSNSNNVSFGLGAGSVITASASFAEVAMTAGMSTEGNTAGTTGLVSNRLGFAGTGGINLSQSVNGQSASLSIGLGTVTAFATGGTGTQSSGTLNLNSLIVRGADGISIGISNGSIIVDAPQLYTHFINGPMNGNSASLTMATGSSSPASFLGFQLPFNVSASMLNLYFSGSVNTIGTSSGQQSATMSFGIYTRGTGTNSTTMSRITGLSHSWGVTANNSSYTISQVTATNSAGYTYSTTASAGIQITSGYTGGKLVQIPIMSLLTAGEYWLGIHQRQSTSSNSVGIFMHYLGLADWVLGANMAPMGSFSSAYTTNTTNRIGGNQRWGQGSWSAAALTSLPDTVAFSAISQQAISVAAFGLLWANQT